MRLGGIQVQAVKSPPSYPTFSQHVAQTITSEHNQHVALIIIGPTGKGKSNAAIREAQNVSLEVARIKGGRPSDYFNIDHVAIITQDEVWRVLDIEKKYGCFIFDDIGVGWGSRNWQNEVNKVLNDIAQTWRTLNNFVILTVPDSFLIDKVPRNLVHYWTEMESSIYQKGLSIGKPMEIKRKYRLGKTHYPYIQFNGEKFVRILFQQPSPIMSDIYEEKRERLARELKKQRLQDAKDSTIEAKKRRTIKDEDPLQRIENIRVYFSNKFNVPISKKEAIEAYGVSKTYVYDLQKEREKELRT